MNETELRKNATDDSDDTDENPVLKDLELPGKDHYFRVAFSTGSASVDVVCPSDHIHSFDSFINSAVYLLLIASDEQIRNLEKDKFKKFLQGEEVKKE